MSERFEHCRSSHTRDARQTRDARYSRIAHAHRVFLAPLLVAAVLLCGWTQTARSQDKPIKVKRTFVPNSAPETWPDRDKDWVPISPVELEQLLTAANGASDADREILWLDHAAYTAVFDPLKNTISGEASLAWRSSAVRPSLLPLEPSNLSLSSTRWRLIRRPAIVGSDAKGMQWVVGDDSEDLLVANWARAGRKKLSGIEFELRVPRALVSTIHLALPAGWILKSDDGLVRQIKPTQVSDPEPTTTPTPNPNPTTEQESTTWRIALGTATQARLLLQRDRLSSGNPAQQFVWSQTSRIAVRSGSIDSICEIDLSPLGEQLPDSIDIQIPSAYVIQSIEQDDVTVKWAKVGNSARIKIPLNSKTNGPSTRLALNLQHSTNSSARFSIPLPRVIRGLFQSGRTSITVSSPIVVATYATNGLRQIESNVTDDAMQMGFHQFQAVADIVINGSRTNDNVHGVNVRQLSFINDKSNGDITVDLELTSQDRGQFEFRCLFPRQWEITSLDYVDQPDETRLQWAFETNSKTAKSKTAKSRQHPEHQVLRIQFADGLTFKKPIRLRVSAELPNRRKTNRNSLPLPALLSLHQGSLEFFLATDSGDSWTAKPQAASQTSLLAPMLLEDFTQATQWTVDSKDEPTNQVATNAWRSFVWDDAPALNQTVLERSAEQAPIEQASEEKTQPQEVNKDEATKPETIPVVSMLLDSKVAPGTGRDEHALTWKFIYPVNIDQLKFKLPLRALLLKVDFNGQSVAAAENAKEWQVPLSGIKAGDRLTVHYTLPSQDVYLRETYRCQIPITKVNVASCRWSVQVPRSVAIVDFSDEFTREDAGQSNNALVWMFGPLGRTDDSQPFNLLDVNSWQSEFERGDVADSAAWSLATATSGTSPQSLTLHLCDRTRLRSMSWFVLVVTVLIGVTLRVGRAKRRGRVGLLWLTACIAASTLIPSIYAELIGSAILGTLFSTLIPRRMIRRRRKEVALLPGPNETLPSTVSLQGLPLSVLLLTGTLFWHLVSYALEDGLQNSAWAQQPGVGRRLETVEVLVPYLGQQFPADDLPSIKFANRVFISSEHLRTLTRMSKTTPVKPTQALVTSARYVVAHPKDERPQVTAHLSIAIQKRFDRSASQTGNDVVLPIPARFLSGRDSCRIDGVSIPVLPDADGKNVRISIPDTSRWDTLTGHRSAPPLPTDAAIEVAWKQMELTLQLLPESLLQENMQLLRMPIPRVANAVVEMQLDARTHVTIGRVEPTRNADGSFALGPIDWLDLVWGSAAAISNQGAYAVKLTSHLEVHSTWLERKTLARYELAAGEINQVSWSLPRGCRINASTIKANDIAGVQILNRANGALVVVDFKVPQRKSFDLSFVWQQFIRTNMQSQPLWELPTTRPGNTTAANVLSHTVGILAANGFRLSDDALQPSSEEAVDAWLNAWPENATPRRPYLVSSLDQFKSNWSAITPQKVFRTVQRQDQTVRISETSAEWEFKAELTTDGVPVFRHALNVGSEVVIDSVAVESDDVDRMSYWYWDRSKGIVYLQLKAPTSGTQNVTLRGRLPIKDQTQLSAPNPRFEDATANSTMLIHHPTDMHVHVDGAQLEEAGKTRPDEGNDQRSITGRYQLEGLAPILLTLERIRKVPSGLALVKCRRGQSPGDYIVDLTLKLKAVSGTQIAVKLPGWNTSLATSSLQFDAEQLTLKGATNEAALVFAVKSTGPIDVEIGGQFLLQLQDGKASLAPPVVDQIALEAIIEQRHNNPVLYQSIEPPDADLDRLQKEHPSLTDLDLAKHRYTTWDSQTEFKAGQATQDNLPTLVMHVLRTGKRRPVAAFSRIFVNAKADVNRADLPGGSKRLALADQTSKQRIELKIRMPQQSNIISVRVDDQYESVTVRQGVAVIEIEEGSHQLDVLWHQNPVDQQLKIRRSQVDLPTLVGWGPTQTFCMVVPTKGTTISGIDPVSPANIASVLTASHRWLSTADINQDTQRVPNVLLNRLLTEIQSQSTAHTFVEQIQSLQGVLNDNPANRDMQAPDSWLGLSSEPPLVTAIEPGRPIEMWVVDQRLNQFLVGLLAAILAAPFLAFFLRLETSDLLARHSMLSWCLIGLVWWTCLIGSLFGFVLFVVTFLTLAFQWLLNRNKKTAIAT